VLRRLVHFLATLILLLLPAMARADLAAPPWYQEAGVSGGWHYRVPIELPGTIAVDSVVVVDVDFAQLLTDLGVDGGAATFDPASVRVVDPGGTLPARQEFVDVRYGGVLDAAGNARGELRFVVETPGAGHYLYFDVLANGAKAPSPATAPLNGHFELSSGSVPDGWTRSAVGAGGDQNNEVYRTTLGSSINLPSGCSNGAAPGLDTSPNDQAGSATGAAWHLLGYRDRCEDGGGATERIRLSRDIDVPAGAAAGVLTFYVQVQSFDGISNNANYDWFALYVDGATIDQRDLGIGGGFPNLRVDNDRFGRRGYGGSVLDYGWRRAELDLSPYAGQTINLRFESRHAAADNAYRAWMKLDDVSWSEQPATLGPVEGFGANLVDPADTAVTAATRYVAGQTLSLALVVDAAPDSVTVDLYDPLGNLVVAAIPLFDDGSHGDPTAGDGEWHNDGSLADAPTYLFQAADTLGSGWLARAFARDGAPALGVPGLLRRPGQPAAPQTQANYFNVDEQTFVLGGARLALNQTAVTLRDGLGGANPKALPGAWVAYTLTVRNTGPDAADADSLTLQDEIPAEASLCVVPACSCAAPCTPGDPVSFDDSASPVATGLAFDAATDVRFSTDGTDFGYSPVPDAAGFDPAVRFLRVTPSGAMAAPSGTDQPRFDVRYVLRLD